MTFTDNEMIVLNILADLHSNYGGDDEFYTEDDEFAHLDCWECLSDESGQCETIFENHGLDPKIFRGVISSLIQKDAVDLDEYTTGLPGSNRHYPIRTIAISMAAFDKLKKLALCQTQCFPGETVAVC